MTPPELLVEKMMGQYYGHISRDLCKVMLRVVLEAIQNGDVVEIGGDDNIYLTQPFSDFMQGKGSVK